MSRSDAPDAEPREDNGVVSSPPDVPPPLADALSQILRRIVFRSRKSLGHAASSSRHRLELRQLKKDRDHFWARLGKTAYRLVEGGEIDHPALRKAMARIDELDARIGAIEAEAARRD